ncbi:MAG: hypothetical protein KQJ78_24595 [Deltaproteobacteria bacterium]|nr:hypothetical protein [Deltaproteobacteria bacterium]
MAMFNFKRFSHVDDLKAVRPNFLVNFLAPYSAYFAAKGITLPQKGLPGGFEYEAMASLFVSTDDRPQDRSS